MPTRTLKLRIDTLAVQSFTTGPAGGRARGDAHPFLATRPAACDPFTLPPRCS